jgi:hypothetical protein
MNLKKKMETFNHNSLRTENTKSDKNITIERFPNVKTS